MLNVITAARLNPQLSFARGSRTEIAHRRDLGVIEFKTSSVLISDPHFADRTDPIAIRFAGRRAEIVAYEWTHPRYGPVDACLVLSFRRMCRPLAWRELIHNHLRPDLTDGVIVDHAEISIAGTPPIRRPSGLGDGYYPIWHVKSLGMWTSALVIDFNLWRTRKVLNPQTGAIEEC